MDSDKQSKDNKTAMKAPLLEEKKEEEEIKDNQNQLGDFERKKQYGIWDFVKFTFPFLWKGGLKIRIYTVITLLLLVLTKMLNVTHPLILKLIIDGVTSFQDQSEIYFYIGMYALTKFSADFVNYIREVPFATVSASAETYIAHMVYNHI